MEGRDYISSLLTSSPMLDLGVLDGAVAAGGDCLDKLCGDPGFAERAAGGDCLDKLCGDPGFAERAAGGDCLDKLCGDPGFAERAAGGDCLDKLCGDPGFAERAAGGDCLDKLCGDPGFAERAARLSSFNGQHLAPGLFGMPAPELGGSREASCVSDPASAMKDANAKKRKANGKALSTSCQVGEHNESDAKRCKTGDAEKKVRPKAEQAGSDSSVEDGEQSKGKGKNAKPVEPPKDYVHVRARRGQATDSHSLAERVRRERISQRMKFLQDLVPGCNKVIGKALMLDEIINYVQSLQRQVEFLSMKLAAVNPLHLSNLPTLLNKDMYGPSVSSVFSLESSSSAFPYSDQGQGDVFQSLLLNSMESQCTLNQLDLALSQATNAAQYTFQDGTASTNLQQSQQSNLWEDDLQSVFHVDNRRIQDNGVSAESFHGDLQAGQMKMEF